MPVRDQRKMSFLGLVPNIHLSLSPFAQAINSARILRNFTLKEGRLARKAFSPNFTGTPTGVTDKVWHIVNFRYTRANAQENELIIFRANGKVYKDCQEIFPGLTGFSALNASKKPFVAPMSNRLFFSDGTSSYVYDGRDIQQWGLNAPTGGAPSTSAVAAGSLTAATGLKACVTAVVLDEEGNDVHESSRSDIAAFQVLSSEDLRIDKSGNTFDSRATHWRAYISESDGDSDNLRRVATTSILTDTVDIAALPAATSPRAPIRNDPPPASTVGEVAKGKTRIFLRRDLAPSQFWFSALGEVEGLLNGAGEESFPGLGSGTLSDLVNSDFVPDREIKAIVEHSNIIFLFTEKQAFGVAGTLNLLDDGASRNMVKFDQWNQGCVGADAALSTPFGLIWLSPSRNLWLWAGEDQLLDLGNSIQPFLDTIPPDELENVQLAWWGGNGKQWLIVVLKCNDGEILNDDTTVANRALILDFALPAFRPNQEQTDPGSWFEWDDITATAVGTVITDDGQEFLLIGDTSGNIKQADVTASPAHLNRSFILGETYLGDTVQSNPIATMRTGMVFPEGDKWTTVQHLAMITGDQDAPGTPSAGTFTEPTLTSWLNPLNVGNPGTGITLTLGSAETSGDKEAWLIPETGGTVGGAFARQFLFQLQYSGGSDDTGNVDNRETARINTIYKMALAWLPESEQAGE